LNATAHFGVRRLVTAFELGQSLSYGKADFTNTKALTSRRTPKQVLIILPAFNCYQL